MSISNKIFSRSLFLFHLGGSACNNCDIEILDALTPKYDLERFGIIAVGSIRHADIILLSGIFNKKSAIRVRAHVRTGAEAGDRGCDWRLRLQRV